MVLFVVRCRDGTTVPVDMDTGSIIDMRDKTWWQQYYVEDTPKEPKLKCIKVEYLKAMLDMLGYEVNKKKTTKQDYVDSLRKHWGDWFDQEPDSDGEQAVQDNDAAASSKDDTSVNAVPDDDQQPASASVRNSVVHESAF